MAGPFSSIGSSGQRPWTAGTTPSTSFSEVPSSQRPWSTDAIADSTFSPVTLLGQTIPEVGYDEGGYGEDGYDAPEVNIPGAALPDWTVYTLK